MNFHENIESQLQAFKEIEKSLKPIFDKDQLDVFQQDLKAKDKANIDLQLAYQFSSLYYIYLRLNGIDPTQNPIMNELERIQTQFKRYATLNGQPIQQQQKRTQTIDKPAVKRILTHELNNRETLGEDYQKKQASLMEEEEDNSRRFEVNLEKHQKKQDQADLNIWDEEDKAKKQVLVKGSLMPKVGHLNWKTQIEKIMK